MGPATFDVPTTPVVVTAAPGATQRATGVRPAGTVDVNGGGSTATGGNGITGWIPGRRY